MPHKDATVSLTYGPRPRLSAWRPIEARHLDELTIASKAPAVERTGNTIPTHTTPDTQVGSQMGTVGIEDSSNPVLTAEQHELVLEVGHRLDVTHGKLRTGADTEPSVRR